MYKYLLAALLLCTPVLAISQEHNHGVNVPDWYDSTCCNNNDCRPVEDSTIQFTKDELGNDIVIHRPTPDSPPMSFGRLQYRVSQDERYHVCYHPISKQPYCVYLRAGM